MMNKISKLKRQDQYLIHEGQNVPQSDSQGGDSQSVVLDASPVNLEETLDSETPHHRQLNQNLRGGAQQSPSLENHRAG